MKTIVLIHTTKSTLETYPRQIREALDFPVSIFNIYDDYFAHVDVDASAQEKADMRLRRLRCFLEAAEIMRPAAIVVACSTISVEAERLSQAYCVPVLQMDEAVLDAVSEEDGKIVVFATSPNPIPAVTDRLARAAARKNKKIEIEVSLCEEALPYLLENDKENYKKAVLEHVKHMPHGDRILLAQGSTAVLEKEIAQISGCSVYSSPVYLIEQLRSFLR